MRKSRLLWSVLFTSITALMLTGCARSTEQRTGLEAQVNLLQKCETPPDLEGLTGAELAPQLVDWAFMERECRERHNQLVDFIKKPP